MRRKPPGVSPYPSGKVRIRARNFPLALVMSQGKGFYGVI